MRKLLALVLLAGLSGTAAAAATADRAALRVTSRAPLTVRGAQFAPRERVSVVATAEGVHKRTVVATRTGTFVVKFSTVRLDRCDRLVIRATGRRGNYGLVRSIPECNPPGPAGR